MRPLAGTSLDSRPPVRFFYARLGWGGKKFLELEP
jgi:hypothetical protein